MNRLKQLRLEVRLSIRALSKYVGITNPVLSLLENEQRPFRQTHIDSLCSFFNVTSDFLLGRTDRGYIVRPQYGDDELLLSEKAYDYVRDNIDLQIIKLSSHTTNVEIETSKEDIVVQIPKYVVYRELKGTIDGYNLQETFFNKYVELGKQLSTTQLKKVIKFIEEYITS